MGGNVHAVSSPEEFNQLLATAAAANKAIVVDFTATWCGPCKMIKPTFAELSEKIPSVTFLMVDVDELESVAADAGISAMPTFRIYKGGEKVDEMCGADKAKLEALVTKYA